MLRIFRFEKDWRTSVIKKTIPMAVFSSLLKPGYESFAFSLDEIRATITFEIAFTNILYGFQVNFIFPLYFLKLKNLFCMILKI